MTERGEYRPLPEIPQAELEAFQTLAKSLVGKVNPLGVRSYSVEIEDAHKIVQLVSTDKGNNTTARIRDRNPIGPDETYYYEELFCSVLDPGRRKISYKQGALIDNGKGRLVDSQERSDFFGMLTQLTLDLKGQIAQQSIMGDPVDEFHRIKGVLTTIQKEKKEKSLRNRAKNIVRRVLPHKNR